LKSGSPPGASITPSSDTNSVTTIRAAISRSPSVGLGHIFAIRWVNQATDVNPDREPRAPC
jgi:hypothetical protein